MLKVLQSFYDLLCLGLLGLVIVEVVKVETVKLQKVWESEYQVSEYRTFEHWKHPNTVCLLVWYSKMSTYSAGSIYFCTKF